MEIPMSSAQSLFIAGRSAVLEPRDGFPAESLGVLETLASVRPPPLVRRIDCAVPQSAWSRVRTTRWSTRLTQSAQRGAKCKHPGSTRLRSRRGRRSVGSLFDVRRSGLRADGAEGGSADVKPGDQWQFKMVATQGPGTRPHMVVTSVTAQTSRDGEREAAAADHGLNRLSRHGGRTRI